jgi:hypothetical protein
VQFRIDFSFGREKREGGGREGEGVGVKIQPECTDDTPTNVPKFTRPDEPHAKKVPAA